ncbi:MAG: reductive dehalogenase [Dehalobacter sp. 4CP]|uniref:reductive dehalogenase n=1 Tax=unclassified Dehalobacter TaxID=2635733 RepID=UPI000E6CE5C0|nr:MULTISPECIES: reductive dehalogenase [unclassified Dehalobacter]MCM1566761.1 reductive dehalogenase [Dehalobacter sp.]NBJ14346.1 reductive dehalogenase [Dehalobacter sp. 4CP]RJE47294.1 reductive dehalogenase [Dehalobacter sp. MCB1]TCX54858.1 reductive dehalogenase [Dehalobacter sp. 12DCB1]
MIPENDKEKKTQKKKTFSKEFSRRGFLKTSLGVGVGAAGAALFGSELLGSNSIANAQVVEHDDMPVEISSDYKRYSMASQAPIGAVSAEYAGKRFGTIPQEGGEGWGQLEFAFDHACWSIEEDINKGLGAPGFQSQGLFTWEGEVNPNKYQFESPEAASAIIKRVTKFWGSCKVGIGPYDERWLFSEVLDLATGKPVPNKLPFTPTNVIVALFEMDYDCYQTAPALPQGAASGNEYSDAGVLLHKLAKFIRTLGYQAIPCSNDTALSIPLAIQAGLGEISRIGIMVTKEYGPRVRIYKLFTDMPLAIDKPVTFGAMEFCKTCMKCADACPSQAISHDVEPSFKTSSITNPGVKKWAQDGVKCMTQWSKVGTDCGICIKVCPYNKRQEWHHDLVRLGTETPAKPVLRFFDDLFGYGKISVPDAIKEFWNK